MTENVIPLGRIVGTNEPVEDLIVLLEDLLERARAGEVHAIAYAIVEGGGLTMTGWELGRADAAVLVGGVASLQYKICKDWAEARPPPHRKPA